MPEPARITIMVEDFDDNELARYTVREMKLPLALELFDAAVTAAGEVFDNRRDQAAAAMPMPKAE